MDVKEFAKYMIDNLGRATLYNALNISNKIDVPNYYSFNDLLNNVLEYINSLIKENSFDKSKCYAIYYITNSALKKYNSNFKYNKKFIINDYIIDIWKVINES